MPLVYDRFLWWAEMRGMGDLRAQLGSQVRGRTLELGAGTGLNLPHYLAHADEVVLTEPEEKMARLAERRARGMKRAISVVRAPAEQLPFADGSFDTVLATLVLCTVDDPGLALAEIRRVLAPGGAFLFVEHVRAESGSSLERWQDRLHGPWHWFAYGCDCNLPTEDLIVQGGFRIESIERDRWRGMPRIVQPLLCGRARVGD